MLEENGAYTAYIVVRFVEIVCIAAFIFGLLWEGTEVLNLSTPEFLMLYGGTGAAVSEATARLLSRKIKKKVGRETKLG